MPVSITHALSATSPDDPLFEVNPSNWNSGHAATLDISATEISGLFSNKNGVSFGLDGAKITASIAAGGAPGSISAGTTNVALGEAVFSNSNGISFGLNGATVTAQHNALTTAMASNRGSDFVQANAAFAGTSASGTIASSGISVSIGPYITTAMLSNAVTLSNIRVSAGTTSNLLSALTFANANGVTFGLNASTVTASHDGLTSQSNQALSGSNGSFTFQTATFGNLNGMSFYTSNGSVVGSYTVPTQSNQQLTMFATGNTTQSSSGTSNASSLIFRGEGVASVGITNGSVVVSVPSGGGGNTGSISAGTTLATLGEVVFSNSNGISFGINGQTLTGSVAAGAAVQLSVFRQWQQLFTTLGTAQGNSLVSVQSFFLPYDLVFSGCLIAGSFNITSAANNSSAFQDLSVSAVVYSRNASTLSSIMSWSNTMTQTWSSNATGTVTGVRAITATNAQTTLYAGSYWIAFHMSTNSTATGGAATTQLNHVVSMVVGHQFNSVVNSVHAWGAGTNASLALNPGVGVISTGATRATIGLSDLVVTGSRAVLAPIFFELRNQSFQI